jgi:hypothetical protein
MERDTPNLVLALLEPDGVPKSIHHYGLLWQD